ncbi:hypothetical protein Q8W71_29170 [Methylobacterium sp. NEAU 140]|uniref:hypothetical protein n=1 Tax=Methylobacterium sp. NEAU 140 TaxID=3064945 RepID=UPI0027322ED2|nr:hypothetical protein [Methylobacterium sp. NEAU 140]MDP4026682.1 hypothetical protein [Methylobacterium sp. NEAU 140]
MKLARILRRDPETPTLRERLAAVTSGAADVKRRATLAAKVGRVAFTPPVPEPEPVDRLALINYATWLFMERRLVCRELYPHMGAEAAMFVAANTAADLFHFPADHRSWQDVPPPSTRAVQILDQVGVGWRNDLAHRDDLDPSSSGDTAERLIAILDTWDGDADLEPDADAEPSLAAPENAHGSQVAWMRGGDEDREAEAPETVLPEVSRSPAPRVRSVPAPAPAPLAWGGNGNVLAAAGVALMVLVGGR